MTRTRWESRSRATGECLNHGLLTGSHRVCGCGASERWAQFSRQRLSRDETCDTKREWPVKSQIRQAVIASSQFQQEGCPIRFVVTGSQIHSGSADAERTRIGGSHLTAAQTGCVILGRSDATP